MMADGSRFLDYLEGNRIEEDRYRFLKGALHPLRPHFAGRRVLDFGASYGLSFCVMLDLGAASIVGVEPDISRIARGREIIAALGLQDRIALHHVEDTRRLGFPDESFDAVLTNAVLEHIPQPRREHVRELW
jgi:2-polyprenyl-3-methyl-5-hydroxy-6-metoxy-1,4-benzoquinol methylase